MIEGVDKKRAGLNCIHHLLQQIPYREVQHESIALPEREHMPDYVRHPVSKDLYIPNIRVWANKSLAQQTHGSHHHHRHHASGGGSGPSSSNMTTTTSSSGIALLAPGTGSNVNVTV